MLLYLTLRAAVYFEDYIRLVINKIYSEDFSIIL